VSVFRYLSVTVLVDDVNVGTTTWQCTCQGVRLFGGLKVENISVRKVVNYVNDQRPAHELQKLIFTVSRYIFRRPKKCEEGNNNEARAMLGIFH
jgi:hypothetical protein